LSRKGRGNVLDRKRLSDYSRLEHTVFSRPVVQRLRAAVVGAGALGNEVVKALGLLGVARVVIIDPDRVEPSNCTRSVLFRNAQSVGFSKAECLAQAAGPLFPDTEFAAIPLEIADTGLGRLECADILFSCVDNDLARLEIASISAKLGLPVCDAGLGTPDYSHGRVSWFAGKTGACFGCKLTPSRRSELLTLWDASVRPCHDPQPSGIAPSTPTMAAITGSLQVELGLRWLMEEQAESVSFEISLEGKPQSAYFRTPVSSSCPFHERRDESLLALPAGDATFDALLASVQAPPGSSAYVALDWPICTRARCLGCGSEWPPMRRAAAVRRGGVCPQCGSGSILEQESIRVIQAGSRWSSLAPSALGLPENHRYTIRFHKHSE
jgi:hypothetical protein